MRGGAPWWQQLIATALMLGSALGQHKLQEQHPLRPWQAVGSSGWVQVINQSSDTLTVFATAAEVDSAVRRVGVVPPLDSAVLRIPYGDARVTLLTERAYTSVHVDRPLVFRWEIQ